MAPELLQGSLAGAIVWLLFQSLKVILEYRAGLRDHEPTVIERQMHLLEVAWEEVEELREKLRRCTCQNE